VRALSPITEAGLAQGDPFAARHPEIPVTRFLLPYNETHSNVPTPDSFRRIERQALDQHLPRLIAEARPDIIMVGRETFVWHVPDFAAAAGLPFVVRIAGGTIIGLLEDNYTPAVTAHWMQQLRKAARIVAPSGTLADGARRVLGLDNVALVMNAIDTGRFVPRPKDPGLLQALDLRDDNVVVMHVSNMKNLKRPLDIAQAAARTLPRDPRLVYVVVGDGPLREDLETACRELGLRDRFRFVGWVDYDTLPNYINLADIMVMPSSAEGLARVYLETQACGRLLLASDIPNAREVVTDGETGLLFRTADIDDFAAKTLMAAADPTLRAAIGRKARAYAEQAHSLDRAVAAYLDIFTDAIQTHRAARPKAAAAE
jgi:glycosyltransferase involved in cell wall biosynthesis